MEVSNLFVAIENIVQCANGALIHEEKSSILSRGVSAAYNVRTISLNSTNREQMESAKCWHRDFFVRKKPVLIPQYLHDLIRNVEFPS